MKLFSLKKSNFILPALCISVLAGSLYVSAEEADPYRMECDTVYDIDLDQDGQTESISYSTWTDENEESGSHAVLEFMIDGSTIWSVTNEDWSYYWELYQIALSDTQQYFLASCITDNDYTSDVLLFTADKESVTEIADITALTRKSEEQPEALLSSWARFGSVSDVSENTFTLNWCDTFMSTGNLTIPVVYTSEDGNITIKEGPYQLDEEQVWTAWIDFEVQVSPEDTTSAYHVSPDDEVRLTEFLSLDGYSYFKCVNADGQEGWFADPESYVSSQTADGSYLMGYFYETIFAG